MNCQPGNVPKDDERPEQLAVETWNHLQQLGLTEQPWDVIHSALDQVAREKDAEIAQLQCFIDHLGKELQKGGLRCEEHDQDPYTGCPLCMIAELYEQGEKIARLTAENDTLRKSAAGIPSQKVIADATKTYAKLLALHADSNDLENTMAYYLNQAIKSIGASIPNPIVPVLFEQRDTLQAENNRLTAENDAMAKTLANPPDGHTLHFTEELLVTRHELARLRTENVEMREDKERLDWLDQRSGSYTGKIVFRMSEHGRGWRLHETSRDGAVDNVREAIDIARAALKGDADGKT